MKSRRGESSPMLVLAVLAAGAFMFAQLANKPLSDKPKSDTTQIDNSEFSTEDVSPEIMNESLARFVLAGKVESTDQLLRIVDTLSDMGEQVSVAKERLAVYRDGNRPIAAQDAMNREKTAVTPQEVARLLRAGSTVSVNAAVPYILVEGRGETMSLVGIVYQCRGKTPSGMDINLVKHSKAKYRSRDKSRERSKSKTSLA